jgi:hypothetical protein
MKKLLLATAAIAVVSATAPTPADAKEKCITMCHFFDAWAVTQVCHDLIFNEDGRRTDKEFGNWRSLKRQALADVKRWPDTCHPDCMAKASDDFNGTPCQYLKLKSDLPPKE